MNTQPSYDNTNEAQNTNNVNNMSNNLMNTQPSSDNTNEGQNTININNMSNNLMNISSSSWNNTFNNVEDGHQINNRINNRSKNMISSLLPEWNNMTKDSFVNYPLVEINKSEVDNLLIELKTILASYKCLNAYPDSLSEEVDNFLEMLDKNPKTVYFEAENINIYFACISSKIDSILINRSKSVVNSCNTIFEVNKEDQVEVEDEGPEYVISVDDFSDDELSDDVFSDDEL